VLDTVLFRTAQDKIILKQIYKRKLLIAKKIRIQYMKVAFSIYFLTLRVFRELYYISENWKQEMGIYNNDHHQEKSQLKSVAQNIRNSPPICLYCQYEKGLVQTNQASYLNLLVSVAEEREEC